MFHIGQRVVCIKTHSERRVVKGRTYVVADVGKGCDCHSVSLRLVGINGIRSGTRCFDCMKWVHSSLLYLSPDLFRPADDLTASLALAESERQVDERPDHINIPQHA